MNQLSKYSYVNAKVRAMLSYLLDAASLARLIDARDVYDVIDELKKTTYRDILENFSHDELDLIQVEKSFIRGDIFTCRKIFNSFTPGRERDFVFLILQRYEIEDLKVILRMWHKKISVDSRGYIGGEKIAYNIDFAKILLCENIEEIILLLDETPYKAPLLKAKDKFKETRSLFYLEVFLDIDYYSRVAATLESFSSLDRSVAQRILGVEIDIENISWLIRSRKHYNLGIGDMLDWIIPGGMRINKDVVRNFYASDGIAAIVNIFAFGPYFKIKDFDYNNTQLLESFLHEILLREVRRALAGFPFTIGTVLGYLVLRRQETKNIVSILYAKENNWSKERIAPLIKGQ